MKIVITLISIAVLILLAVQLGNNQTFLSKISFFNNAIDIEITESNWLREAESKVPLLFSETQRLAQASCTALKPGSGWVLAVSRDCEERAVSCKEVCAKKAEDQAGRLSCFNSLHIYGNQPSTALGELGLKTYKYNNCSSAGCGPNFCCCSN